MGVCVWGFALVLHLCICHAALVQRRNQYREGLRGVQVWVSPVLHAQVKARAAAGGLSISDFVVDALREKVTGDGGRCGRDGVVPVAADGSGSGVVAGGGGDGSAGVGGDDGSDAGLTGANRLAAIVESSKSTATAPSNALVKDEWMDIA